MKPRTVLALGLTFVAFSACEDEGGPGEMDIPPALAARAEVSLDQARETALALFSGAEIVSGELEEEGGALIYSFDVRVAGQPGVEEVHVDAHGGTVLSREHESDEDEAADQREEDRG
jgi:uncharacterized membrane protein YkoI